MLCSTNQIFLTENTKSLPARSDVPKRRTNPATYFGGTLFRGGLQREGSSGAHPGHPSLFAGRWRLLLFRREHLGHLPSRGVHLQLHSCSCLLGLAQDALQCRFHRKPRVPATIAGQDVLCRCDAHRATFGVEASGNPGGQALQEIGVAVEGHREVAHRPLQWGFEVLTGEAKLHQPSLLTPQNLLQHLAVLTLPQDEFSRLGTGSVELCSGCREVYLALRHDSLVRREELHSLKKLSSLR